MTPELTKEILAATDGRPGGAKHEILCVLDDIAVLKAYQKPPFEDAHFTGALRTEKGWRRTSHYAASAEKALLDTMGYKHGGPNSQFGNFAAKALGV